MQNYAKYLEKRSNCESFRFVLLVIFKFCKIKVLVELVGPRVQDDAAPDKM